MIDYLIKVYAYLRVSWVLIKEIIVGLLLVAGLYLALCIFH